MRTVGRNSIVEWKTHVQRINNSVSKISFEGKEEKVKSVMKAFSEFTTLEAKLIPMLKKGLQIYYDEIDDSTGAEHPFEAKVSLMVTYSHEVCFGGRRAFSKCSNFWWCRESNPCLRPISLSCPLFRRKKG